MSTMMLVILALFFLVALAVGLVIGVLAVLLSRAVGNIGDYIEDYFNE